jgi:hypothetical protein
LGTDEHGFFQQGSFSACHAPLTKANLSGGLNLQTNKKSPARGLNQEPAAELKRRL